MQEMRTSGAGSDLAKTQAIRASVSFPPDVYKTLEDIAQQKKVSMAWVVREAVDKYLDDKWPLLGGMR